MRKLFICLLMAVCVFSGNLFATETTAFGPQVYKRTTGQLNVFTDTFSAPEITGRLVIRNGSEDDQHRVTSATVTVNGIVLLTPADFHHADYLLESPVDLQEINTIEVELASTPETYLEIEIVHDTAYTVAFGPEIFERTNGRPNVYDESFSAIDIEGRLIVRNGSETGENRVASGTVTINGVEVFNSNDFKKLDYMMECTVDLTETNTLQVVLASTPGNYLEIEVLHEAIYPSALLEADPVVIIEGNTTALSWASEHAQSCYLACDPQPDIGEVDLSGTLEVSPEVTTTYTLMATGLGGIETASAIVEVIPLPTVEITAIPETIIAGNTAELSWVSANADTVSIDNGIGAVDLNGTVSVSPETTTTYTITATGPGGTATSSALVTVIPNPVLTVAADMIDIIWGESCEISWQSLNADTVTIDNGISGVPLSGSVTVSPTQTTVYTITAVGPGGTITATVTVNVTIPPPTVTLTADPPTIIQGEIATLSWTSTFAQSITIDNGLGSVATSGSMEITPAETTTYNFTATGPGGTINASVTIEVIPLPTVTVTATPDTVMADEPFVLTWTATNADTVVGRKTLADGTVTEEELSLSGNSTLTPIQTTTYTVIATGPGGTIADSITVTVTYPQPEITFTAEPDTIYQEGTSFLSWTSNYADSCSITPDIGNVDPNASIAVTPDQTTTYTITATGAGGTSSASVTVTVNALPPYVTFSVEPEIVLPGESATLIWETYLADSCQITPEIGEVETSGSLIINPEQSTTYTLTATGPGGEITDSVDVTVPAIDLIPLEMNLSGSSVDAQTLSITGIIDVTVQNNGSEPVDGIFTVILFEDTDNNELFDPAVDNIFGLIDVIDQPAGNDFLITSVPVDGELLSKGNRIFVYVDSENDIRETDEGNNIINNMTNCEYELPVGSINPILEWAWDDVNAVAETRTQVVNTPLVANLNDDNGDGVVDTMDIPDIIFLSHHVWYPEDSVLRAISGDGSASLFDITGHNIFYSEPAVGDIDGDGAPEILVCENSGHVLAFSNSGELKWTSDPVTFNWNDDASLHIRAFIDGRTRLFVKGNSVWWYHLDYMPPGLWGDLNYPTILNGVEWYPQWPCTSYYRCTSSTYDELDPPMPANGSRIALEGLIGEYIKITQWPVPSRDYTASIEFNDNPWMGSKWYEAILYYKADLNPKPGITLADIDEDGSVEIIVGRSVLNNDGTLRWIGQNGQNCGHIACVANLDLEGYPEVIVGNTAYKADGELYWNNNGVGDGYTAVANFDDDPFPEVVTVSNETVSWLEHTGEIKWSSAIPGGGHGGAPVIADLDNDGQLETGVAGALNYVVFGPGGSVKWQAPINDKTGRSGASAFDLDGDGSVEIVHHDEQALRIFSGIDGTVLFEKEVISTTDEVSIAAQGYPIIADVDNDSHAEIVVGCKTIPAANGNRIMVFGSADNSWHPTRRIWNQHGYHITNIEENGAVPQIAANSWDEFNNYRQNQSVKFSGCTDISACYLRINTADLPDMVDISARVNNGGSLNIGSGVNIAFYNGDPENGGIFLGKTQTSSQLKPGQYEDVYLHWDNPLHELLTIYVIADDDGTGTGTLYEVNEDNNLSFATLNFGNHAPVVNAGPDQAVPEGNTIYLDGSGSYDPEGASLNYTWEITAKPDDSTVVLTNAETANPSFEPDLAGTYIIQLIVNDGQLDSGVDDVQITISTPVAVPEVIGLTEKNAIFAITAVDLLPGEVTKAYDDTIAAGCVISQSPETGTLVPTRSRVNMCVSLGVQVVVVPDVRGMTLEDATAALDAVTLDPGEILETYISTTPAGYVLGQEPAAGTEVVHDTVVDMEVSLGPWTGPDTDPPNVTITATPTSLTVGNPVSITVTSIDNAGVISEELTINGDPITLINGQANFLPQNTGFFVARATATDAAGLTGIDEATIAVSNPYDTYPPIVSLDETDCPDVTDLYSIAGQVSDQDGVRFLLAVRPQGTEDWDIITEQIGNSFSGELGVFDPSVQPNGVYEILLFAEDPTGNTNYTTGCMLVDGNLKLGAVILPNSDLSIPAPGMPVALERTYDSRIQDGDFGKGWQLPSSAVKTMTTRQLSEGWAEEVGGSFFTTYYLVEKYRHVVVIRFSDEDVLKFKMDVTPKSSTLLSYSGLNLKAAYVPLDDTQGTLVALNAASDHLMMINNQLLEYGTDPYEPVRFRLTLPDGTVYIVNKNSGLESMTDVYGHTVTYGQDGITHSSGVSLSFERDMDNRIETVTDSFGRTVTYHYDQDGMLEKAVQSTTVNPYIHHYVYEMGTKLEAIKAPDGTKLGSFEYDYAGRLTALIDADGNRIIYGHDIESHTQEITDRLGRTTLYEYDSKGNVTYKLDADGRQSYWTYDDHGNKLTETDPAGLTKSYTYDDNDNMLSETDALGNVTSYTYNDRNDVLITTDPMGNVTENIYNANGDLLTTIDALGNITEHAYDTDGNLTSTEDALGNLTQYEYDASGNRTKEIDPSGNQTLYTFDDYGNELTETTTRTVNGIPVTMTTTKEYDYYNKVTKTIDPYGHETTTEYNYKVDKESATVDKNGARLEFTYDGKGSLTQTLFADGSTAINTYDGEGNRLSSTDRNGRTTEFFYDSADRLVKAAFEDGTYTEMEYDAAGRMTASIDERGNRTEFEYDDAGRRTAVTDALGKTTTFAYDDNGNQISMTDANGHTTEYVYDELNRRIETIFHDGTFTETVYDAKGNKTSETDQNGRTTGFEYDANGNLTAVVDVDGNRSEYTYDEVGNKLTFKDANGRIERWKYDDLGRVIEHTLPLGMSETFTYDPNGNTETRTDFNNKTTSYDYSVCCNRLDAAYYPDGSTTSYTYLPGGQRVSATDSLGTTQYIYDIRGRLEQVTNPDGSIVAYTYDAAGNRSSIDIPSGAVDYTFDALNRLETVTDANAGVTIYTYDDVGNRASVTYPNGVKTIYTYDDLNRLIYMETANTGAQTINSYSYTLDAAGNRTQVQENNGRIVDYTYDNLYRLIAEDILDSENGNQSISYSYDNVGNRLIKTVDGESTSYDYDINNRLTTETTPTDTITYSYDSNGNQIKKQSSTEDIIYGYDYENRLVSVDDGASLILYEYDVDGIKTQKTVDGVATKYLIDKNRDYAQVLEEIDGAGSLVVGYVYGDDLISQNRSGVASYFHYDGIGSTRALTDELGDATDTYNYEAFGNILNQTGSTINIYRYAGEQYDPNLGFYYLRARWLNPEIGRFISYDPWWGIITDPSSIHKYSYTANNPANYYDPSGYVYTLQSLNSSQALQSELRKQGLKIQLTPKKRAVSHVVCLGVKCVGKQFEIHHIGTNKHKKKYKQEFKDIFSEGNLNLNHWANKIKLPGHKGKHSKEYHEAVRKFLEDAVEIGKRRALQDGLDLASGAAQDYIAEEITKGLFKIAGQLCKRKGKFHNLLFRK